MKRTRVNIGKNAFDPRPVVVVVMVVMMVAVVVVVLVVVIVVDPCGEGRGERSFL